MRKCLLFASSQYVQNTKILSQNAKMLTENAKMLTHIDLQMGYANELAPAEVVWTIKNKTPYIKSKNV